MSTDRNIVPRYLSWDDLVEAIANLKPSEVSLDLFDTVISRSIANEAMVDWLIGSQLTQAGVWPETAETYLAARQSVYDDLGVCSIDSIYQADVMQPITDVEKAAAIERAIELYLCEPIPGVHNALDKLRNAHGPLTFLSDMHLRQADLQAVLDRHKLFQTGDRLIVSGEEGASKHDGDLFTKIWPTGRSGVVHVGNNEHGDGFRAAQAGLKNVTVDRANPTRYERVFGDRIGSFGPVIAGAAKKARLDVSATGYPAENATTVGTQFIALAMQSFLLWARAEAKRKGCNQLVFVARDGELPLKMAQAMPEDYWDGFTLKYLQCGRLSWSLAAASVIGVDVWTDKTADDDYRFLTQSSDTISVDKLIRRVGLEPSAIEASDHLANLDLGGDFPPDRAEEWRTFLADPAVRSQIEAESLLRKDLVIAALKQSDLEPDSMAFVDVGWRGYQAWLTSALVEEAFGNKTIHLHFGGGQTSPDIDRHIDIQRFAFDGADRPAPIDRYIACIEMFLAAGRPRLTGYRWNDGIAEEVFGPEDKVVATQTVKDIWSGAIRAAHHMPSLEDCVTYGLDPDDVSSLAEDVNTTLSMFWNEPNRDEAEILQGLRFETDDDATIVRSVVIPYTAGAYLTRRAPNPVWQRGSVVASSSPTRATISGLRKVKSKLRR